MFCQHRGLSWDPFTHDDVQSFYDETRTSKGKVAERFLFNRLVEAGRGFFIQHGWVPVGGGWIVLMGEQYHFTPDFITRCFSSEPAVGLATEGASFRIMKLPENMTPGPWALRGYQVRADNGQGKHVATYQTSEADGRVLAASRELLDLLLMATENRVESFAAYRGLVARCLVELKLVEPETEAPVEVGTADQRKQDAYGRWKRGSRANDSDRKAAFDKGCFCHYLEGDFHHDMTCPVQ
jgi:hypothetical protein